MTQFFGWLARTVLLPLTPAIVGSVMRSVYSGKWGMHSLDSAELSFCVALIGVVALSGVNRLNDRALRDALSPVFIILLAVALCLFAGSLLMKEFHEQEQLHLLSRLKASQPVDIALLSTIGTDDRCASILIHVRSWSAISGAVTVLIVILARLKYSIEDADGYADVLPAKKGGVS